MTELQVFPTNGTKSMCDIMSRGHYGPISYAWVLIILGGTLIMMDVGECGFVSGGCVL